jgi:UDP-N-acetylglucosamine/UDP-N-acetylgalactosamine diphosphorylase
VGFCRAQGADLGSKVCAKTHAHEKVGVICAREGQGGCTVVEYSEMDRATAELTDASGRLVFGAGNVCIHYYSMGFLQSKCAPATLPKVYHIARKAIPHADPATGHTVQPSAPTGIKLESFIFDVFPAAARPALLDVPREDEFAPVKNAPGAKEDSPDTARAQLLAMHARWVAAAGAAVQGEGPCEVSALASYAGEGLGRLAGATLQAPCLLLEASEPLPQNARPFAAGAVPAGLEAVTVDRADGSTLHVYRLPAA